MWALSALIGVGLPLHGNTQTPRSDTSKRGAVETKLAAADQKFMAKAAGGGKTEVELGRLASERGTSDAVKQFAQRMVADHGKANEELTQPAQRKGIALPADLDAKHKQLIDRLAKLSGAEFNRAYSREMQRDHDADVKEFQHQAKNGNDADVKASAAQTLPVLQEHQRQAHQLGTTVGTGAGRRAPSSDGSANPSTPSSGSSKSK
jgi:putative membrane protein